MQISTERLILREFTQEDWSAILAYQSEPHYLRYYEWETRTEADVRAFVQIFLTQQKQMPRIKFQLAVVLKSEGKLIGNCGIRKKEPKSQEADIGYELASDYWGKGYATEAARTLLKFGFEELKLHRIWSWCIAENIASVRVSEKIGMQLEGRLRENEWFKSRWWDTLIFGILENEWRNQP